jgi:hypothetical protein
LSYWPLRLGIDSWAPLKVYKYGPKRIEQVAWHRKREWAKNRLFTYLLLSVKDSTGGGSSSKKDDRMPYSLPYSIMTSAESIMWRMQQLHGVTLLFNIGLLSILFCIQIIASPPPLSLSHSPHPFSQFFSAKVKSHPFADNF